MTIELSTASVLKLLERLLAARLASYGRLSALEFDADRRSVCIKLVPVGRKGMVWVELIGCRVDESRAQPLLCADSIRASQPWLQKLLCDQLRGELQVAIPPLLLSPLRMLFNREPSSPG